MLGVHVTKESHVLDDKTAADELHAAITRDAKALSINCVQIFTHGPRFPVANKINYDALITSTKKLDLSVHSAYMTTGIWNITGTTDSADQKRINFIKLQLAACEKAHAWGLVLHINKISPTIAADVMKILKPIVKKTSVKLVLEMVSSKASPLLTYETPEKINRLTKKIGTSDKWWGWCVDTAHLWGAGVDVTSYDQMKAWLDRLEHPEKILMFHLNGSSVVRGSGKDVHEIAFGPDDDIWRDTEPNESGVRAIAEFAKARQIPIICEINRGAESDVRESLDTIKKLLE